MLPYIDGYGGNQNPFVGIPNSGIFFANAILWFAGLAVLGVMSLIFIAWVAISNDTFKNYLASIVVAYAAVAGVGLVGSSRESTLRSSHGPHVSTGFQCDPRLGASGGAVGCADDRCAGGAECPGRAAGFGDDGRDRDFRGDRTRGAEDRAERACRHPAAR